MSEKWLPVAKKLQITGIKVSDKGRFKNREGKIITVKPKINGLLKYRIKKDDGIYSTFPLTKLLMCTFKPENEQKYVIFKDGDKTNYCIDNLEWSKSITRPGRTIKGDKIKFNTRKVIEYDEDLNKIKTWSSIKKLADKKGISTSAIVNRCKHYPRVYKGSIFKFRDEKIDKKVKDLPNEKWKKIKTKKDTLYVSNLARVKNRKKELLKQNPNSYGYYSVRTRDVNYLVHQLVALAWIPNPEDKDTVNHIDLDKKNNKIKNLEWATRTEQEIHKNKHIDLKKNVIVVQVDKKGNIIEEYESTEAAAKSIGCTRSAIGTVCNGTRGSCYGKYFQYKCRRDIE